MPEPTSVLFGFKVESLVLSVNRLGPGADQGDHRNDQPGSLGHACGGFKPVKDRPLVQLQDVPATGQRTHLWW